MVIWETQKAFSDQLETSIFSQQVQSRLRLKSSFWVQASGRHHMLNIPIFILPLCQHSMLLLEMKSKHDCVSESCYHSCYWCQMSILGKRDRKHKLLGSYWTVIRSLRLQTTNCCSTLLNEARFEIFWYQINCSNSWNNSVAITDFWCDERRNRNAPTYIKNKKVTGWRVH